MVNKRGYLLTSAIFDSKYDIYYHFWGEKSATASRILTAYEEHSESRTITVVFNTRFRRETKAENDGAEATRYQRKANIISFYR